MEKPLQISDSSWKTLWKQFKKHRYGHAALYVILLFCLMGVYAPFLASSKPFCVFYDNAWYFPLFRYLFYSGYFTKNIDIFFNLLIFTLPIALVTLFICRHYLKLLGWMLLAIFCIQIGLFLFIILNPEKDPAANVQLITQRRAVIKEHPLPDWNFELAYMTTYAKLNLLIREQQSKLQNERLLKYPAVYEKYAKKESPSTSLPTLWQTQQINEEEEIAREELILKSANPEEASYKYAQAKIKYIQDRRHWIDENIKKLQFEVLPLVRHFHWEDDAGGEQNLNQLLPWWELTRINRKDLTAALIFGVRISLVVGIVSVVIALAIGVPIGAFAGFYGGTFDIIVSRLLEIWESMPTFFMLLFVIAVLQSKSVFLVIFVLGIFGWTTFSRYIRGEFFKQRSLPYVEACKAIGFHDPLIIFSHILPNAIPPLLTLLPFAIMGAITGEAGLSFLGLGEEGSCSWGVLMDEGRRAFPGESYLLWPPAILLTILLIAIALAGDALRDALDPKMHR
jgi:peptide/nickel transport system permease protein